jgi:mRNA-degrading endonuclease RelE of RelBE toxin-antitoxin system
MKYKVISIPHFDKEFKRLSKKHHSIKKDLANLVTDLVKNPILGNMITKNCYKIRMAITSKGKGKSGGARIITYVIAPDETIFLLSIYDKSEQINISDKELSELIESIGL